MAGKLITKLGLVAATVAGVVALGVGTAGAADPTATTYVPPTTAPVTPTTNATPNAPTAIANGVTVTLAVGQSGTYELTGLPPNTPVTITINGTQVQTGTTSATGTFILTITVSDPHIAVNGSGPIPANFGNNTLALVGSGSTLASININIPQPASAAAATSTSGTSGSSLAFTGADITATVVGGLALLALGTVLVIATRRRSARPRTNS